MAKVRPNDPCPCGSGKKYKKCCGAAGDTGGANPEAILDAAFRYLNQGRFADAVKQAQKLVNGGIRHPDVFGVLGMAYYQLGKLDEAEQAMQQVTRLVPRSADAFANLGLVQFEGGKYQAAVASCGKALELDPSNAPAYNNLGNVFLKLGSYAEAEKNYRKALEFEPENVLAQSNLGFVLNKQRRHEEAVEVLESTVRTQPDFAAAYGRLAESLVGAGRFAQALEALDSAAKLEPKNPVFMKLRGDYFARLNKPEDAERAYHQALKLDSNYGDAYIGLAELHSDAPAVSQGYYQKALQAEPKNPRALVHVGIGLLDRGYYKPGRQMLDQALELDPASGPAHAGLAMAAMRQFQFDFADREIQRAMKLDPDDEFVVDMYTGVLTGRDKLTEAIAVWEEFLADHPESDVALVGLARCYEESGDSESAAAMFEQALGVSRDRPALYIAWALFEERRHNIDRAVELVQRAIEEGGAEAGNAWRMIARCRRRQGRLVEALEAADRAEALSLKASFKSDVAATNFEKGAILDKLGRYPEAFEAFETANTLTAQVVGSGFDDSHDWVSARIQVFGSPEMKRITPLSRDRDGPQPIFVVGFPRSGTTLMEQILGSHAQVAPAGELPFIATITREKGKELLGAKTSYPHFLLELGDDKGQEALAKLRDYYLAQACQVVNNTEVSWFVDKMPLNLNHLGLIRLLFPRSPIIHMLRHPLDSCLSSFMSNFNQGHAYSNRIDATARQFERTARLGMWYRDNLDLNYLAMRYEDLVDDQEGKTHEALEFIGVPWDENCLQFYRAKRVARTASYAQVTQKIYTSSRFRYKNYYEQLRPVFPILEETVRAYGYTIAPPESE